MFYLQCFSFLEPILRLKDEILQLHAVGQVGWNVLHLLEGFLQSFHAVKRPEKDTLLVNMCTQKTKRFHLGGI